MNGIFSNEFAVSRIDKGQWKIDTGLANAVLYVAQYYKTAIDLGAGIGRYVSLLRNAGLVGAIGYDGIEGIGELSGGLVREEDLTAHSFLCPCADLALCIETGEHIPQDKLPVFIRNIAKAATRSLMVSWAIPKQRGRDHISCRTPEWVAAEFGHHGWHIDEAMMSKCREIAGKGWDKKLLVFKR